MKWNLGKFGLAIVVLGMMKLPAMAADQNANLPTAAAVRQSATVITNQFSNWSGQSTNLTVRSNSAPWGRSYSTVIYGTNRIHVSPERRAAMEALAKARSEAEPMRRLQERLKEQGLAEKYRVRLGE